MCVPVINSSQIRINVSSRSRLNPHSKNALINQSIYTTIAQSRQTCNEIMRYACTYFPRGEKIGKAKKRDRGKLYQREASPIERFVSKSQKRGGE